MSKYRDCADITKDVFLEINLGIGILEEEEDAVAYIKKMNPEKKNGLLWSLYVVFKDPVGIRQLHEAWRKYPLYNGEEPDHVFLAAVMVATYVRNHTCPSDWLGHAYEVEFDKGTASKLLKSQFMNHLITVLAKESKSKFDIEKQKRLEESKRQTRRNPKVVYALRL